MEQEWLLCDLHLHSENSKITKVGDRKRVKQMSAKDFVEELHEKKLKFLVLQIIIIFQKHIMMK